MLDCSLNRRHERATTLDESWEEDDGLDECNCEPWDEKPFAFNSLLVYKLAIAYRKAEWPHIWQQNKIIEGLQTSALQNFWIVSG